MTNGVLSMLTAPTIDKLYQLNLGGMARALVEQGERPDFQQLAFEACAVNFGRVISFRAAGGPRTRLCWPQRLSRSAPSRPGNELTQVGLP
jgi:hypothetical protein